MSRNQAKEPSDGTPTPPPKPKPSSIGQKYGMPFLGTIALKNAMPAPDGRYYWQFHGMVDIIKADAIAGFEVQGNESNWCARVQGPTSSVTLLGCQIRGAYEGPFSVPEGSGAETLVVP